MGYTHYFTGLRPNKTLAEITEKIIQTSPVTICGGSGEGEPMVKAFCISFNGCKAKGESFETFYIDKHPSPAFSNFCKTSHKPYDTVVVAVLVAAIDNKVQGWHHIGSDGTIADWKAGMDLYEKATGRTLSISTVFQIEQMLNVHGQAWTKDSEGVYHRDDNKIRQMREEAESGECHD